MHPNLCTPAHCRAGPIGQASPTRQPSKVGAAVDRRSLAVDEVADGMVTTSELISTNHI
jgi:hypothetical protein